MYLLHDIFGTRDEREIELNRDGKKAPWNQQSGVQVLKVRPTDGITITAFVLQPIPITDVRIILLAVILPTGVVQLEYTKRHTLHDTNQTIVNACNWLAKKVTN